MVQDELEPHLKACETPAFSKEVHPSSEESHTQPLMHQLARTFWALKIAFEKRLGEQLELSGPLMWILLLLAKEDGRSQAEITSIMRVDASAVTRMVKEMEQKGWITRLTDPADNRRTLVYLTDTGRAKTEGLAERASSFEAVITARLSSQELDQFKDVLRVLTDTARLAQG